MIASPARFVEERSCSAGPVIGLTLGGIPAVVAAGLLVGSMPLETVRWMAIVVVIYTAIPMLYTAAKSREPV